MAVTFAQSAIAVLTDMAQRGELDPWDIQVLDVFDRCLRELESMNRQDLSHSGQAFVYASMLILLKSDRMVGNEFDTEDCEFDLEAPLELDHLTPIVLPTNLEKNLQRRAVAPPPQRRKVTLQDLIEQLELIADTLESKPQSRRRPAPRKQGRNAAMRSITELAHAENLSEIAAELEEFLRVHWHDVAQHHDWLEFDALLEFKGDRVGIFWALLFLSSQSKVELSQEEFYRDLKLRPFTPPTTLTNPPVAEIDETDPASLDSGTVAFPTELFPSELLSTETAL